MNYLPKQNKNMKLHRRQFISTTTKVTAASLLLPAWACQGGSKEKSDSGQTASETTDGVNLQLAAFGIQLYTLRDVIGEDPTYTLEQLGQMGYTQIESYEGPKGMFWGMSPSEYRSFLYDNGMRALSSHAGMEPEFERKAAEAAEAGMSFLACPWIGPQESMDDFKRYAERFNECGEICKQNGLRFAYHNHAYSFEPIEGEMPQDVMMQMTDPELVDFQMDIYWVVTAGQDPVEWMKKYPNRWTSCHVKDRMKNADPDEREASCDLGTGSIDYPTILAESQSLGMKYFILEQERYDNSTPMESTQAGAAYLKQFA